MNPLPAWTENLTRRHFFSRGSHALGWAALASLGGHNKLPGDEPPSRNAPAAGTHHAPRARHVIFLHMVGGPSQMDLFDYKPGLERWYDRDLPASVHGGQRRAQTADQARLPIAPSRYRFARHGKCGMWVSELLPWTARMVDDLCFVRSMHTEAINHDPGICFLQTGNELAGRPCLGAWASYGLSALNSDLPTFAVLVARATNVNQAQAISTQLWSAGFLPGEHAGVSFRSSGAPILYLENPPGVPPQVRRRVLDGLRQLNEMHLGQIGDPETRTRIQQYEMTFRMQASVPELVAITHEPESTFRLYGEEARTPGTFANVALLASRLVERGVRFVQIYHNNWDSHQRLAVEHPLQCRDVDRACYGLIQDLKRKGLYDSTLVIWGGEFGRTIYSQGDLSSTTYGRDHHPRCFTMWLAGGGVRPGTVFGATDEFSYNVVEDPVHVRDFHATVLHLLGFDHQRFSFRHQGLDQRLTGVEAARVVHKILL